MEICIISNNLGNNCIFPFIYAHFLVNYIGTFYVQYTHQEFLDPCISNNVIKVRIGGGTTERKEIINVSCYNASTS